MYQDNITLCGASAYEKKFYFNQDFNALPDHVKKELQIMCVLYTEDVGGILTLEFDENGRLQFKTEALEADARYDEIGSGLKIKQLQQDKKELLESLETPEHSESQETSESPEHPESPRPDFFSSGINNKKTGNPCIHLLGQVRMRALGLSISVLFCLYKCGYARASC